jgi:hypothetical protein
LVFYLTEWGGMNLRTSLAELKQDILRINNNLNIAMYGVGLRKQRIFIIDDTAVMIVADHKRIPALAALDLTERTTTRFIDSALLEAYKKKLEEELKVQLQLPVKCVLKDYTPKHELATTVILLEEAGM